MGNVPILHAHTVNKRLLCGILGGDKLPFDMEKKSKPCYDIKANNILFF